MAMSESEWLTSTDPAAMLEALRFTPHDGSSRLGDKFSDRKLRLACQAVIIGCNRVPVNEDFAKNELQEWASSCFGLAQKGSLLSNYPYLDRCAILRDIIGNPWRPITEVYPGGFSVMSNTSVLMVSQLANVIYDKRRFDLMPILADALEEAGCEDWWILSHLRGESMCPMCLAGEGRKRCSHCHEGNVPLRGPHVRGCWALDLILGKE
jgi:hypothetical protein